MRDMTDSKKRPPQPGDWVAIMRDGKIVYDQIMFLLDRKSYQTEEEYALSNHGTVRRSSIFEYRPPMISSEVPSQLPTDL